MHIHLLQNNSIKGNALLTQLQKEGFKVDSRDLEDIESRKSLRNEKSLLFIIDVECLSEVEKTETQKLCNEKHRVVLLGDLTKTYWLFEFPCQTMGYVCHSDQIENLYSAIAQLKEDESYISETVLAFLKLPFLKQQQQLLGKNLPKPFTQSELKILREIARGKKTQQIASEFFRSLNTVNNHRKNISRKLFFKKDLRLIKFCIEHSEAIQTLIALSNHKSKIEQMVKK